MDHSSAVEVWGDADRPCGRCGTATAGDDSWLCDACRKELEAMWGQRDALHYHESHHSADSPTPARYLAGGVSWPR